MIDYKIFHCNKTYNERWLSDKKSSNGIQYKIIQAIIKTVVINQGDRITQKEILDFDSTIKEYIERRSYKIVPSSGTELSGNGRGIHHVKYSSTKSVAVIWQNIKGTIYFTFDDHAPIKYHRAIYSFHQLRLGRQVFPLNARCSRLAREILKSNKPWRYRGINLRNRYYYK